jgi:DNA-binding protein HU-beta
MTKKELVESIAKKAGITLAQAKNALEGVTDAVKGSLKKGKKVTIPGFGTFTITRRKARKGRNPRTGEIIKIAASKLPKFTAGKGLKDIFK